jgi:hypothetical protein
MAKMTPEKLAPLLWVDFLVLFLYHDTAEGKKRKENDMQLSF